MILVAVVALGAWVALGRTADQTAANTVRVMRGAINATVEAVGKVRPVRQANLSLRVGGKVAEVKIQPGDRVAAGQVLLIVASDQVERDVQQAQLELQARRQRLDQARAGASPADIEAAQAAVREATVAREVAQAKYDDRAKEPDASTSQEAAQLEAAKAAYQRARATLERALTGASPEEVAAQETAVKQGELALKAAQNRTADTQLLAPFAGVILEVNARVEENVGSLQPVVLLADLSQMQIEVEVEEVDAPTVQAGQSAEIRLDAFPGETLQGTVSRVAPAASTQRGAVSYTAVMDLAPTSLALKPGLSATAKIATRTKTGVLLVPSRAVQPVGRQKIVKVVRGGRAVETEVTVGLTDKQMVEIVDGVREGDLVVVE
ncbi:MAG: efflux RND transporter periplasmic adaptor subunit [Anaerolineae bacterium]|nr:efflux RND transporter periplasmic adaptor subunit [Anaerolineae bacterium]